MEPEKSSNDDQIFGESEGESGTNNGSKHPTNELGLFTVPADNEDQSSQFGNINLNLSIDTKKTQVSKDIDCGANTEEEIDKIDNSNQKIKLNENNQNKSLNDNKNAIISTSPLETNTDNNIQPLDKINNNQDQKKTKSESQNPENSTIDKVDYKNIDSNSTIKTADNIIGHQKDQSKIINNPPIGLPNPSSYSYLNSILQTLFSCQQFREEIIEIYQNNKSTNCDNENKEFVVSLGNLFFQMKEGNENEAKNAVKELHKHFDRTIYGDDIHICYLQILTKINDEIKIIQESDLDSTINNLADKQFSDYRQKNYGLIFDLFCGQISFKQKCKNCSKEFNEKFQLFKTMPLQIPLTNSKIKECIECFFEESRIDGSICEDCKADLFSFSEITHSPQFIFIYLVRGAYSLSENKNNTFIKYDNYINIPTLKGNVLYKLRSVIDHLDGNESGHYFVKTLSGPDWYLLNDVQVRKINSTEVVTKHSIGLLIEKVTNFDENILDIPEPLIDYDTKCFYQNGFQSILQIFYLCCDIRQYFIDIYTSKITNENNTQELNFIETLGQIFYYIRNMNEQEIINAVKNLYEMFGNSLEKNDIYKCYFEILNKMNDAIKSPIENHSEPNYSNKISADEQFLFYKSQNNGIIFDNFFGQILFETKCENKECNKVFHEKYQLFSILPLQIQSMEQNTPISECIESYFEKSKLEGSNYQCCDKQDIICISHCTHSPRFVFIYLVRGKNDTKFIEFDNYINIPNVNGNVLYKLRSVIDRSNYDNAYGGYLVKILINSKWWLKKDNRVKKINPTDVPTKYTIGLLIEKVANIYHNVPETLLRVNYNFQVALQSIFQMLYLCVDIRQSLIEFYTNYYSNEIISENLVFKRKIAEIMFFLENENESERIKKLFSEASNFLPNKIIDIHELYLCVVNKLNEKRNQINSNVDYNDSLDESGFKRSRIHCENCTNYSVEISQPQMFKSLYLKSQNNKLNLSKRIESFCKSQLDVKNDIIECCNNPKIVVLEEILSAPKYLFIYLDRIEGNVEDNKEFILNTQSGTRRYFLLSLLNYTIIKDSNGQTLEKFSVKKFESKSIHNPKYESIIAVMMERVDENISISNSENDNRCRIDMKTKDSFDSTSNVNDNLINLHISLHKNDYHSNISNTIAEEKLESDFIAQSIKQIIELNKDKKIHVLLGLLFSCTSFRNFMISLYNNYQIKKVFEKFALIDIGIFVNNICSLYHQVINRKTICSISKSDENKNIQQCFNYILGTVKLITKSEEFIKSIASDNLPYFNFINDNFYGEILLDVFCIKCSKKVTFKDSFNYLCVKKSQNESSISLKKCLNNYIIEENHQPKKKCCQDAQFILTRKIIHAPPILFICVDEKSRNINQNCVVYCDSILTIDTTNGPVTYSLVSLIDRNAENKYNVKFLGNSDWWQTYPKPGKINTSGLISKFTVGFLLKQLN